MDNNQNVPFVSVVIPVFNSPDRAPRCIEALLNQTYPKHRYEIIVVDNGSTDSTPDIVRRYPVRLLTEDSFQSPYTARNCGIAHSRGEVIALIDINCFASSRWIEEGVATLKKEDADLCGGKVTFTFSDKMTYGEIYDSMSNVQMKRSIEERGVAKTGNLFVRRHVFDSIGGFPRKMRSGGDVLWTGRAKREGFNLVYSPAAEVTYPARRLVPLLKKSYRVGKAQPIIWRSQGVSTVDFYRRILRGFRPPSFSSVRRRLEKDGPGNRRVSWQPVWAIAWLCALASTAGRFAGGWRRP